MSTKDEAMTVSPNGQQTDVTRRSSVMETTKQIVATGKMSNLVNMWAFIWDGDELLSRAFIYGKADDQHYIVQAINALTGEPNICKIVELKDMVDWTFYPNRSIAEECYEDYCKHKCNRYKLKLGKNGG